MQFGLQSMRMSSLVYTAPQPALIDAHGHTRSDGSGLLIRRFGSGAAPDLRSPIASVAEKFPGWEADELSRRR